MKAEDSFTEPQVAAYRMAHEGDIERLLLVTRNGVSLNEPGKEGMTMLGFAVLTADRRAILSLMHAGANANQVIPNAGSPAILAITHHYNPPRVEAVAALLEAGYDPNQLLSRGMPYLFYFVDYNHWPGFYLAIERGGNINIRRKDGESLLTYLVQNGDYRQAREIIQLGADCAARGERGETALRAIEFRIRRCNPSIRKAWEESVAMRQLILSKLPDPKDRCSAFTDEVEEKIRQNP
uniref:Uncharacterized protein n=1 Tax=Geobacter sp. (strain M21) TaxID=443144 RepID=C6E148_GEOSM